MCDLAGSLFCKLWTLCVRGMVASVNIQCFLRTVISGNVQLWTKKANNVFCVIWQYDYSATLWTLPVSGIVIFVSSRRCALHAGGQLLPFPIIALRSRLSSRPPARPLVIIAFRPALVCPLCSCFGSERDLTSFPSFLPFSSSSFSRFCVFGRLFFFFLRRGRIRAAGELLRFLLPFRFVRADFTTFAHCAPLMVSFYPAL